MKIVEHLVTNEEGIHAQPAMVLVHTAKKYSSDIFLWKNDKSADMKNMFEVVGLCVQQNTPIRIEITGDDEEIAAEEFIRLIADNSLG